MKNLMKKHYQKQLAYSCSWRNTACFWSQVVLSCFRYHRATSLYTSRKEYQCSSVLLLNAAKNFLWSQKSTESFNVFYKSVLINSEGLPKKPTLPHQKLFITKTHLSRSSRSSISNGRRLFQAAILTGSQI